MADKLDIDAMLAFSHLRCPAWHFMEDSEFYDPTLSCPRESEHEAMAEAYPLELEKRKKARMIGSVCQRCGAKRRSGAKGWAELCPRCQREVTVKAETGGARLAGTVPPGGD